MPESSLSFIIGAIAVAFLIRHWQAMNDIRHLTQTLAPRPPNTTDDYGPLVTILKALAMFIVLCLIVWGIYIALGEGLKGTSLYQQQ